MLLHIEKIILSYEKGRSRCAPWIGVCSCLLILQKKPPRENDLKQISSSSSGSLSPNAAVQSLKHEWKIVASEKTSSKQNLSGFFHRP